MIAACFRLYYIPKHKPVILIGIFFLIPLLLAAGQMAANAVGIGILQNIISNWFRYDSAPVYFMTIALFTAFLNIQVKSDYMSKIICFVAPLTLGVYLIHAHADVSPWLWETLALPKYMDSLSFPAIQLGYTLLIFLICAVIDALRRATIGRLEKTPAINIACKKITAAVVGLF